MSGASRYPSRTDSSIFFAAAKAAVGYVRTERKPCLVEFVTYRFLGHGASDNRSYRTREEEEQAYWRKAATLVFGRHPLIDSGSFAGFMPQVSFAMTLDQQVAYLTKGCADVVRADEEGYLYFIDKKGNVSRAIMKNSGKKKK